MSLLLGSQQCVGAGCRVRVLPLQPVVTVEAPLGETLLLDGCEDRAARFADMSAVAEPAVLGELGDLGEGLIEALVDRVGRPAGSLEYGVGLGVRPEWQSVVADRGDRMRVTVPFGPEWYPLLMDRLAQEPGRATALLRRAAPRERSDDPRRPGRDGRRGER